MNGSSAGTPRTTESRGDHYLFPARHKTGGRPSGWSVLVQGQAEEVAAQHSTELSERTERSRVQPWAPGEDFRWLRIIAHGISGRRIDPGLDWRWEWGTAAGT